MKKFVHSLKFKILITVGVILLIGHFIGTVIWVQNTVVQTKSTMKDSFSTSLYVANQNFENAMKDIERICALASSNVGESSSVRNYFRVMDSGSDATDREKLEAGREVKQFLLNLCRFQYYLTGVAVNDLKGHQQTYGIIMNDSDLQQQEWMREFLESEEETVIIPPHNSFPNESNKIKVFSLIRKIKRGNEVWGIVIADVSYEMLKDFYYLEELLDYPVFVTEGEEGHIIFPEQEIYAESEKQAITMELDMPITGWKVHGIIPEQSIIISCISVLKSILVTSFVLYILLFLAIGVVVHLMTKELSDLADAVKKVSGDHMELGILIKGRDEVGELYKQTNRMLGRIKELIGQIQKSEDAKRKLELMALQEQINPHFLYNTLNTISYLAQLRGIKNIQSISMALSDMMHLALDSEKFIPIEREIAYLKQYIEIMEYKYSGKFVTEFQVDEESEKCLIPKLILQPLVENSLKHGIATISRPGYIRICVRMEKEKLFISVWDNGNGITGDTLESINRMPENSEERQQTSIGVYNVRNRIYLLYGDRGRFQMSSAIDEYTLAELEIPVEKNGERLL